MARQFSSIFGVFALITSLAWAADYYQAGDRWDKTPVSESVVSAASPALAKLLRATAKAGGATAFYLGKHDGRHLMATNYHVYPYGCRDDMQEFQVLKKKFRCTNMFGSWKEIDMSLFEISVPASDEALMAEVALKFGFNQAPVAGELLLTAGYGSNQNPFSQLQLDQGKDCKVISSSVRFMGDPDSGNRADYEAWSFSHGCETSHGDSGSAIVNRDTATIVGLIWTAALPKAPQAQVSATLDSFIGTESKEVWTLFNYGVPATKVAEVLAAHLRGKAPVSIDPAFPHPASHAVIESLLTSNGYAL